VVGGWWLVVGGWWLVVGGCTKFSMIGKVLNVKKSSFRHIIAPRRAVQR
jgi:hypothetical protein